MDNTQEGSSIQYNMVAGALYEGLYHFTPEGELEAMQELLDGLVPGIPASARDTIAVPIRAASPACAATSASTACAR